MQPISFLLLWCSVLAVFLYISSICKNTWMTMPLICLELGDSFLSCRVATYVDFLFWSILVSPHRSHIIHEVSRSYVFLHSNVFFYKMLVLLQTYFSSTLNICFDHCTISLFYINLIICMVITCESQSKQFQGRISIS